MNTTCRLCAAGSLLRLEASFRGRCYDFCPNCKIILAEPYSLPTPATEKERYLMHKNSISDAGYVAFLNQAIHPVVSHLLPTSEILDYGCGPDPVLAHILEERRLKVDIYDPYFFPDFPDKIYDIIFATECFEHFFFPSLDIAKIMSLLNPGGQLVVMTDTWKSLEQFSTWHYIRDVTHVSFYHQDTILYISQTYGLDMVYSEKGRIFVLRKHS